MTAVKTANGGGRVSLRKVDWELLFARSKYWIWQVGTKIVFGLIYFELVSEGLRQVVPPLAKRLYKVPGLSFLHDYEATYRLDLATFFSLFLLIAVWWLWTKLLILWCEQGADEADRIAENDKLLICTLGFLILGGDAYFFFKGVSQMGWNGSFSFSALVATTAYVGVLIFVLYMSLVLKRELNELEGK